MVGADRAGQRVSASSAPARARPVLMGVLNLTPDSFSDGGRYLEPGPAVEHALRLCAEGADWIDVGGESTRPGARAVPVEEQLRRVVPVVRRLSRETNAVISIDTTSAAVAARAIDAGARVVNDVSGLSDSELAPLVARSGVDLVVMHARGTPEVMQRDTAYADLVGEVVAHLALRVAAARDAGVPPERILVDPGLGFGKAPLDNPRLVAALPRLRATGHRVLIGGSRKAFVGQLTGVERASDRVCGSVGVALAAALLGAHVLRVHDVKATADALATFLACVPESGVGWWAEDDRVGAIR